MRSAFCPGCKASGRKKSPLAPRDGAHRGEGEERDHDDRLTHRIYRLAEPEVDAGGRRRKQAAVLGEGGQQSGVGRGYFTMADVQRVNERLLEVLGRDSVHLEKIYVAPESPDAPSHGRKPSPQFLFDARDEFGIKLGASFMVGDKLSDLESGWNAGVKKCLLVRTGYGAAVERDHSARIRDALVVNDLSAAVDAILTFS